ncbi:hypothetical protein SAMN04515647_1288 [Cohaesibacter sp. ES.047]|uniref:LarC family nickel insertion protein n=1 Tax=Cohaesibacter sp. ES.047 TaxID=1798205 RepID=UPI000BB9167C|nr:LarC family nickel insertion protein [Cohaesibacter sp. ES.047]SNY91084.1 hypothetical protein SAMN04515647_1288 [Cohaesibacter sp. ES.047]
MHIHLDVSGGIAGDMFTAALLDAQPDYAEPLLKMLRSLDIVPKPDILLTRTSDGVLCGHHFDVVLPEKQYRTERKAADADNVTDTAKGHHHNHHHHHDDGPSLGHHDADGHHDHAHAHHHDHHHRDWRTIRVWLKALPIDQETRFHALGIFALLAQAEATVHGVDVEDVQFHEVGAWDTIVDTLAASWLIARLHPVRWSASKLPWGGGMIKTDHGLLPSPAPATMQLLKGFEFRDDGIPGERITPTGAAILAWLKPDQASAVGVLSAVGHGFGTRKLPGMSNILRASLLETASKAHGDEIMVLECDIDDQSPEALAVGLETLRADEGVIDVTQSCGFGKKGRMTISLRLLAKLGHERSVADRIFAETTTLGIRCHQVERFTLTRGLVKSGVDNVQAKWVERPGIGKTLKVEMDDLAANGSDHHHREAVRRLVEQDVERALNDE